MPNPFSLRLCRLVLSLAVLASSIPAAMAQADVQGQWSTASYQLPINPIHSALMYNGKVLVVAGSGNCMPSVSGCPQGPPYGPANGSGAVLVDPTTGSVTQFTLSRDMFCNGMVVLPDGRVFINGGTVQQIPLLPERLSPHFSILPRTYSPTYRKTWLTDAGIPL